MNWDILQRELASATAFQLRQIDSLLTRLCEDPARLARIRDRLRPGQIVRYWDVSRFAETECEILELRRTIAVVKHTGDGQIWRIDMSYINVESEAPLQQPSPSETSPHAWTVGDAVCFRDRDNRQIVGQIVKLNPKRAKVRTDTATWTVSYGLLTQIVDAEATISQGPRRIGAEQSE